MSERLCPRDYVHKGIADHFGEMLIQIDEPIITEQVSSTFKNGLLTIVCPLKLPNERIVPIE